jgi:MYXO-CTERM domain-containing protein
MKTVSAIACAALLAASANADVSVGVDPSSGPWLGFMNVFELPANGGGFVFGSSWGIADLVANFNDGANTLTMSPNTIGDPNEFWYQDPTGSGNSNPGGPGAPGNKIMEANLYQQVDGSFAGQTVTFSGSILSNSFTDAHVARVFIRDFAADFSSSVDVFADAVDGNFSISLDTINDASRHVQWGIQVRGVNVWVTDTAPFGNLVVSTIPAPGALAVVGLGGLVASRRRRA